MENKEWTFYDKSQWPVRGAWDAEPDKVQWADEATGLPCLAVRNRSFWCGYVGVSKGHPAFEKGYDEVDVSVHGGLTFAAHCQQDAERGICHVVEPGEDDYVWWLGFDCYRGGDYRPPTTEDIHAYDQKFSLRELLDLQLSIGQEYRDLAYVKDECTSLAKQLAEIALEA